MWEQRSYVLSILGGFLLFAVGGLSMMAARTYLLHTSIHTVSSPDLLLDLLPSVGLENFLVWGVPAILVVMAGALFLHPNKIPFALKAVGLLFLLRAFFVILTPMGIRPDQIAAQSQGFFQNLAYGSNDFFFSGHVSFPFLFAMIFWEEKLIRSLMLGAAGLFAIGVLLEHTHYSVDVFAVPFIVPGIHRLAVQIFGTEPVASSVPSPLTATPLAAPRSSSPLRRG